MRWHRALAAPDPEPRPASQTGAGGADPRRLRCLYAAGFIANRADLARRLAAPVSLGDRDLLVRAYERFGAGAAGQICGPFTWALWDGGDRRLVAARDRAGVYELHYAEAGEEVRLAGGSDELLGGAAACWNAEAIVAHVNGEAPPPGTTFHAGIRKLEPGEVLTVTRTRIAVERYWRLARAPARLRLPSAAAYASAYRDLLFGVAAEYAPAGAAGITLSGGLDSTAVAAALVRTVPPSTLTAIRWVTPELPAADEDDRSALVCHRLGLGDLPLRADLLWTLRGVDVRTPLASPFLNFFGEAWDETFRQACGRGLGVLFTGISGDHLFGAGVSAYADLWLTGRWLRLARQLRRDPRWREVTPLRTLRSAVFGPIAYAWVPPWSRRVAPPVPWLGERHRTSYRPSVPEVSRRLLPGRRMRVRILKDRFLPQVVAQLTAHAARHGVELRHPLLDHRLVEFAAALPTDQTFAAGDGKTVVREALRGVLPAEVVDQHGKVLPTAIVDRGLREREQAKVWPLLHGMRAADLGFVDEARLRDAYRRYLAGDIRSSLFWFSLTLEAWLREHFA